MFSWLKKISQSKPQIIMIAAIQSDRGIGYKNNLIHSIQNDMRHFIEQTNGHTVIMGRKNWESIPEKYRPLKNRQNIIITRNKEYKAQGADIVSSITSAIQQSTSQRIYIIGGGQIYEQGLVYADFLDLTIINKKNPADVFFPAYKTGFNLLSKSELIHDKKTNLDYEFQIWKRKTEE